MSESRTNESVDVRIARIEEAFKSQSLSLLKIELILEKLQSSITDRLHDVERNKLDIVSFQSDKKEIYRYVDKVEENLSNQVETTSSLVAIIEKYQIEQRGGYKYIVASIGAISVVIGIAATLMKIL